LLLTFDDGPDPEWTPRVLDALAAARTTATFFVLAPRALAAPDVVARTRAEGHAVELHGWAHARHTSAARAEIESDTRRALDALGELGVIPQRWRTPWGAEAEWTPEVAAAFGLELVGWSADTHDWRGDAAEDMLARCEPGLDHRSVLLLHDALGPGARRSGCEETVRLIGPLVEAWRARSAQPAGGTTRRIRSSLELTGDP